MSMPTFPNIPNLTLENSVSQVISSIAMEELALSHILNAEGEKLQYVLGTLHDSTAPAQHPTIDEILEVNESVKDMLSTISMNQMFLWGKLSAAMSAYHKIKNGNGNTNGSGGNGGNGGSGGSGLEVVDGHILHKDKANDTSDWLEIAKYGNYSLIVRKDYINIQYGTGHTGDLQFQYTPFGNTDSYDASTVRTKINNWFTDTAEGDADKLPADANLRNFTMKNTATKAIGSGPTTNGVHDGFSKPIEEPDRSGLDVAFALSYGEAANFISKIYSWGGGVNAASPPLAQANFEKLQIPSGSNAYDRLWLRSPGNDGKTASSLFHDGRVYQTSVNGLNGEYGLVYPALWVKSSIFN